MTQPPDGIGAPAVLSAAGFWAGFRQTLGYGLSVIPFGLAFGAGGAAVGMTPGEAILMSALTFAGSAQFAVLGLWAAPLPLAAIAITTFVVNARHIVMGAAMQPHLAGLPRWKVLLAAAGMTDASWALTLPQMATGRRDAGLLLGSMLVQWPIWVGGTALGVLLGSGGIDTKAWGLDLLVIGFFATAVIGLWRGKGDALPWIAALAASFACVLWVPGNWHILAGGFAAGLVGLFSRDD